MCSLANADAQLLEASHYFLSLHDVYLTHSAILDLSEVGEQSFDPASAVNVMSSLGFKASFGQWTYKKLKSSMCPFIAFDSSEKPFIVLKISDVGSWTIMEPGATQEKDLEKKEVREIFSGYVILVSKPLLDRVNDNSRWFFNSFKSSRSLYVNVAFGTLFSNVLALFSAFFIMVVYDRVVPNSATESLVALTIGVILALSFEYIINVLNSRFTDKASMRADARVARVIFERILMLRLDSHNYTIGRLSGIVREFDTLREFFTSATLIAVVNLPFVFIFIWVIYLVCGPLALVPFISVLSIIFIGVVIQPILSKYTLVTMESKFSKQSVLVEALTGLETVKATGSGGLLKKRFEEASDTQAQAGMHSRFSTQIASNLSSSIIKLNLVATVVYGVFLIDSGLVTIGSLFAAVLLGNRTLSPLNSLTAAMSRASAARQAYRMISKLLNDDSVVDPKSASHLSRPSLKGEIEFKNVSFYFGGSSTPAVSDVSFKIAAGQKIALLGGMGSGKSTLIRLMSGLISPSSGAVLFDGIDIRQISDHDLRRNVGTMLQNTWLFSGSIRENIRMGFSDVTDQEILQASLISSADDFISKIPAGYDLELTENGNGLSGGQRQTLNLARALIHDPNILLLDEPSSSMDKSTEKKVLKNLTAWSANKTICFVTHREAFIEMADRVLIMKEGKLLADTTPKGLAPRSLQKV